MNNLDIFLLVCFLTLAKCSKFSEAAETLHISQSSFSKNIQSLEQIFGTALFIRGSHGSVLTEAGHALMPYAENIVREYGKAEKLIASYRKNRPSMLVVNTHSFLSQYGISEKIFSFRSMHPDTQIEINELNTDYALDRLKHYPLELAVVFSEQDREFPGCRSYTLTDDRLILAVGKSHRLAGRECVHISELKEERLQIMHEEQETFLYSFIFQQFKKQLGLVPNATEWGLWYTNMPEMVRHQNLAAILPGKIARTLNEPEISFSELSGIDSFSVRLLKSENNDLKIAQEFIDYICTFSY